MEKALWNYTKAPEAMVWKFWFYEQLGHYTVLKKVKNHKFP